MITHQLKSSYLASFLLINLVALASPLSFAKPVNWEGRTITEDEAGDDNAHDYIFVDSIGPDDDVSYLKKSARATSATVISQGGDDDSDSDLDYDPDCDTSDAWSRERWLRHSLKNQAPIIKAKTIQPTPKGCLLYRYYDNYLYCSPRPKVLDRSDRIPIEFSAVPDFMKYFCWNSEDHQWAWSGSRNCGVLSAIGSAPGDAVESMAGAGSIGVTANEAKQILGLGSTPASPAKAK